MTKESLVLLLNDGLTGVYYGDEFRSHRIPVLTVVFVCLFVCKTVFDSNYTRDGPLLIKFIRGLNPLYTLLFKITPKLFHISSYSLSVFIKEETVTTFTGPNWLKSCWRPWKNINTWFSRSEGSYVICKSWIFYITHDRTKTQLLFIISLVRFDSSY